MAKEDMLGKVIRRLMDFPPEELGPIYDLLEKCTGKLNGKEWRGAVKEFLRRGPNKYWNIWKTIQLGTGLKNADQFRGALKNGGFKISDSADDIMEKITISSERVNLSLVIVTGKGLGFSNTVTIKEAYERAQVLGLKPCPSEAGPQLRLQYQGLPNGECLLIAMEPIKILMVVLIFLAFSVLVVFPSCVHIQWAPTISGILVTIGFLLSVNNFCNLCPFNF